MCYSHVNQTTSWTHPMSGVEHQTCATNAESSGTISRPPPPPVVENIQWMYTDAPHWMHVVIWRIWVILHCDFLRCFTKESQLNVALCKLLSIYCYVPFGYKPLCFCPLITKKNIYFLGKRIWQKRREMVALF